MASGPGENRRTGSVTRRSSTPSDINAIAGKLDRPTHAELVSLTGFPLLDTLCLFYTESDEMFTVEAGGEVIALGGAASDEGCPSASVWLVCAPIPRKLSRPLVRTLRDLVQEVGLRHGLLYGYVDARNKVRQRWLETLGFNVNRDETRKLGHLGLPFYQFNATSD